MQCLNLIVFLLPSISTACSIIDDSGIQYSVFTREGEYELRDHNLEALNSSKPIKFILHGWTQNAQLQEYVDMKDEYLKYFDYTVVLVDWSKYGNGLYIKACKKLPTAGHKIATVLDTLNCRYNFSFENMHVVGHSLGGQLAGVVGRKVHRLAGKKLKRITVLDAAKPLFEGLTAVYKCVSRSDAKVVDAIHTCSSLMGIAKAMGTVDFYPNNGKSPQPGCGTKKDIALRGGGGIIPPSVRCSHKKSNAYFTQSIGRERYEGHVCPSWSKFTHGKCNRNARVVMGEQYVYEPGVEGKVFLRTTDSSSNHRPNNYNSDISHSDVQDFNATDIMEA